MNPLEILQIFVNHSPTLQTLVLLVLSFVTLRHSRVITFARHAFVQAFVHEALALSGIHVVSPSSEDERRWMYERFADGDPDVEVFNGAPPSMLANVPHTNTPTVVFLLDQAPVALFDPTLEWVYELRHDGYAHVFSCSVGQSMPHSNPMPAHYAGFYADDAAHLAAVVEEEVRERTG